MRQAVGSSVTWGVGLGLVVGKTIGVFGAALLAIKLGIAVRLRGATNLHLIGIALAAGIGFTVALFVTGLAFEEPAYAEQAKVGILMASFVAAALSAAVLRIASSRVSAKELEIEAAENAEVFAERPDGLD
jgi:NhaA family Na+:H+ antiporter